MSLNTSLIIVMALAVIAQCEKGADSEPRKKRVGILTLKTNSISKNIAEKYSEELEAISQDVPNVLEKSSFIASGYVRWLEKAGLEPIALDINADYETLLKEIVKFDGLLLTGGNQQFFDHNPDSDSRSNKISNALRAAGLKTIPRIPAVYLKKVSKIVAKIKEINDSGRKYPIWATCLGFEALIITESKYTLLRHKVNNKIYAPLPIEVLNLNSKSMKFFDPSETKMFGSSDLFYFNHKWGFLLRRFKRNGYLKGTMNAVASINKNGEEVLVWFDYIKYPFIGTQFHPEKFERESMVEDDPKSPHSLQKEVNHKIALLFKSLMDKRSEATTDATVFDSEVNDAKLELQEIGKYKRILFYVRDKLHNASS